MQGSVSELKKLIFRTCICSYLDEGQVEDADGLFWVFWVSFFRTWCQGLNMRAYGVVGYASRGHGALDPGTGINEAEGWFHV